MAAPPQSRFDHRPMGSRTGFIFGGKGKKRSSRQSLTPRTPSETAVHDRPRRALSRKGGGGGGKERGGRGKNIISSVNTDLSRRHLHRSGISTLLHPSSPGCSNVTRS